MSSDATLPVEAVLEFGSSSVTGAVSVWLAIGLSGLCWAALVVGVPAILKLAGFLDFG